MLAGAGLAEATELAIGLKQFDDACERSGELFDLLAEVRHLGRVRSLTLNLPGCIPSEALARLASAKLPALRRLVVPSLDPRGAAVLVGDTSSTVTIDPDAGLVTALAELPPGIGFIVQGTGAFDPATDRMFEVSTEGRLLVIDADNGVVLNNVELTGDDVSYVIELTVNNVGELVGLGNNYPAPWTTVRIDPLTGVVTTLSHLSPEIVFLQGQAIHDPAVDQVFLQNTNLELLSIAAGTGELLVTTPILTDNQAGFINPVLVP